MNCNQSPQPLRPTLVAGVKSYLVGAMDDDLLQQLVDCGVPTFAMHSGLSTEDLGWGSTAFHKMVSSASEAETGTSSMCITVVSQTICCPCHRQWDDEALPHRKSSGCLNVTFGVPMGNNGLASLESKIFLGGAVIHATGR